MASPCMEPGWIGRHWQSPLLTMERRQNRETATCSLLLSRSAQWWTHFTRKPCNSADRMKARRAFAVRKARKPSMPPISGIRTATSSVPTAWVRHSHQHPELVAGTGWNHPGADLVDKRKNPHQLSSVRVSFHLHQIKSLAVTYFRIDKANTSIGAERFHFRVRKGIGWFPLAMAARQTGRNGRVMARPPLIRTICFDVCRDSSQFPITICHVMGQIAWVLYGQVARAISTG